MKVLGLEGLNSNYEKFRGFVKMGQSIRDKICGAKVQFPKVKGGSSLPWLTSLI